MQLRTGLNPYGLTYHLGLQGRGTPRANPNPVGLEGFIALTEEVGGTVIELCGRLAARTWTTPALAALRARLEQLGHRAGDLARACSMATSMPASATPRRSAPTYMRFALTPILCGDRAAAGQQLARSRRSRPDEKLAAAAPKAAAAERHAADREPPGFHLARARRLLRRVRALGPHRLRHRQLLPGRRGAARLHPRGRALCALLPRQGLQRAVHRRGHPARALPDGRRRGAVQGAVRDPRRAQRDDARRDRDRRARGASRQAVDARVVAGLCAQAGSGACRLPPRRAAQPPRRRRRLAHAVGAQRRPRTGRLRARPDTGARSRT